MTRIRQLPMISVVFLAFMVIVSGWAGDAEAVLGGIDNLTRPPLQLTVASPSDLKVNNFPGILPVSLEWKDHSSNETGFIIERSTNGGTYSKVGSVGAGVTTFTDSSVTNDLLCRYRVYATGVLANSGYSNEAEWVTIPNNPSELEAKLDDIEGDIDLSWKGNNINSAYQIQKTTLKVNQSTSIELINLPMGTNKYEDTNVKPGNTYSYTVMAVNQADRTRGSNLATIYYLEPPTNVMVSYFPGSKKLSVKWQDNSSEETKFIVQKAHSNPGGIQSYEVPANTTEFVDDVWTDYYYMYRIMAVGPNGEYSPYSAVFHWYAPPRMPGGFKAGAISSTEVKLTWNDQSQHETGFKIWRKGDNMYAPIDVGPNVTTIIDKGLKPNTGYSYTITALNNISNTSSDDYPPVSVTTLGSNVIIGGNVIEKDGITPIGSKLDVVLQIGVPSMVVNGSSREIDPGKNTAPVIVDGRTLVPIRAIIESYGGEIQWEETEQKVTVICNGRTIELWINSPNTVVNGKSVTTEVTPRIINERTMLPLRFISENLGLNVEWDPVNKRVTIKT